MCVWEVDTHQLRAVVSSEPSRAAAGWEKVLTPGAHVPSTAGAS